MFQGDWYVGMKGTIYLITLSYEDIDNHGVVYHSRAYSEPPINQRETQRMFSKATRSADFNPLAPSMPMHYSPQIEPELSSPAKKLSYVPLY